MLLTTEPGIVRHIPTATHHSEPMPSNSEANKAFARLVAHLSYEASELLASDIDVLRRKLCLPAC